MIAPSRQRPAADRPALEIVREPESRPAPDTMSATPMDLILVLMLGLAAWGVCSRAFSTPQTERVLVRTGGGS